MLRGGLDRDGRGRLDRAARRPRGGAATAGAAPRWTRPGRALGTALAGAVNLVDPAAVVLGGAYAELADWLLPGMRRELAERVRVREWPESALASSALGRRGPLLGAALVTIRRILDDPGAVVLPG